MKNVLVIAGVFVGAVLAAVLAWAVVGGSGGVRQAALVEPVQKGSVGALTIEGVRGATAMPVRSFNWRVEVAGTNIIYRPLEMLRDAGPGSPEIFSLADDLTAAAGASLELTAPGGSAPYLSYGLGPTVLTEYRAGKHEKVSIGSSTVDVRQGQGKAPDTDGSDVVGYMTLREQRIPILAFDYVYDSHADSPGYVKRAVIRRPLDQLAGMLKADLVARRVLGTVTIELQTSSETEPHVTYALEDNVLIMSLTDSAAAGVTPAEEVELSFKRMRVSHGQSSACYFRKGQTC